MLEAEHTLSSPQWWLPRCTLLCAVLPQSRPAPVPLLNEISPSTAPLPQQLFRNTQEAREAFLWWTQLLEERCARCVLIA